MEIIILGTLIGAWLSERWGRPQSRELARYGARKTGSSWAKSTAKTVGPHVQAAGRALVSSGLGSSGGLGDPTKIRRPTDLPPVSDGSDHGQKVCYTWIEYVRLYHPSDFDSGWYIEYQEASSDLADYCYRTLDEMMTRDAALRGMRLRDLRAEFKARLKAQGKRYVT